MTRGGKAPWSQPPYFKRKLAIVGRTNNVAYTPWYDPKWSIVAHPCARGLCKREPDWYFDLHRPECFTNNGKTWNDTYWTWLKTLQTPIFMQEEHVAPWNEVPMAVRYPIERVLQEFRAYFTNHPAYMIALALQEGVEAIGIFGCQYSADTEHSTQRGSLEYWLGRAEQAGVDVILPVKDNTVLGFPAKLYGYQSHDEQGKLCGDYIPKLRLTKADKDGKKHIVELMPFDPTKQEDLDKLAKPPDGAPIAFDRMPVGVVVN
jgi:hypothetical protein